MREARRELEARPLTCGEFATSEKQVDKWLGQMISSKGLADSVAETVAAREGKIRGAVVEIMDIVNDWRARVAGGLEVALMMWERCCIPSLLYGAGTWVNMTAGTVTRLNKLQNWFLRMLLQVGQGAPLTALAWETGCLDMGLRVAIEKVMLIHHIRSLDEDTLARRVYEEQRKHNWPGLFKETTVLCEELRVEDVNNTSLSKKDYRQIFIDACKMKHEEVLRKQAESQSKTKRIFEDNYGSKAYFENTNIFEARQIFRARTKMMPFAANFSGSNKYKRTNWLCKCGVREEESHLVEGRCPVYQDIWEKYNNLEEDTELARFFGEVLARRTALEEQEEEEEE